MLELSVEDQVGEPDRSVEGDIGGIVDACGDARTVGWRPLKSDWRSSSGAAEGRTIDEDDMEGSEATDSSTAMLRKDILLSVS